MLQIKVVNVGQGDCLILSPDDPCCYSGFDIFVDVGPGARNVFQFRDPAREVIVLLSHAHKDHIGGLKYMQPPNHVATEIWVPCYYGEVLKITNYVLRLRGMDQVPSDNGSVSAAQYVLCAADLMQKLAETANSLVVGCYEGMPFQQDDKQCAHLVAYNPPLDAAQIFGIPTVELDRYIDEMRNGGHSDLRAWFEPDDLRLILGDLVGQGEREVGEGAREADGHFVPDAGEFGEHSRRQFLYAFFLAHREAIQAFVDNPSGPAFDRLYRRVRATSNNTSVVLAYASDGSRPRSGPSYAGRILLTGDAERPVFSRLRDPALPEAWRLPKAGILKMPHHGSWGAIDRATLRHIQPKLAIVSHGNRRFGTHVDPHPHIEVVRALRSLKICALYTNDVVKSSGVVAPGAADGPVPGWQNVEFVK